MDKKTLSYPTAINAKELIKLFTYKVDNEIHLELLQVSHTIELFEVINKNKINLQKWMPWISSVESVDKFQKIVNRLLSRSIKGLDIHTVIFYKQELVGAVCLTEIDSVNKKADIGYWLDKSYRKRGIVSKTLSHFIHYSFESLKLNRLTIKCSTQNVDSNKVAQRLGFKLEGCFKEWEIVDGKPQDFNIYGITTSDWENSYRIKEA
ncbi:GNAT family N-acetyltransferase [Proteinivorax tanatarense]|uniref:GNAT family N-acetyltransferase n=1 Tax=Proteinivorax tanatarense TaxID=1260629 RepID=A0AAU7VN19_9FIRM